MRGRNANQLIEGIQLSGSGGHDAASDFNKTLRATDPITSAIHEHNQMMRVEQKIDS